MLWNNNSTVFVTSRSSVETAERIELFFCMEAFSDLSYSVLQENSDIYKNKGTSLWDCVPNSGLRKFRHSISIVETCYQHAKFHQNQSNRSGYMAI